MLSLPKPYSGIHPKVVIQSVAKNNQEFNKLQKIDSIYIPNRDMQSYDELIPAALLYCIVPTFSMQQITGGALWS
ncbi:hypothetical protein [Sulfurimonas indica]|uniref:hypothetical protein n=1 Tax=Sulfurimonas indica TaxID=2508707 RepID=UPI00126417B3|nr:hypothetical protein [Sulfurimonas indica]